MIYDADVMKTIIADIFTAKIVKKYGRVGGQRLREVLEAVRFILDRRPAETFTGGLCVLATIDPEERCLPASSFRLEPFEVATSLPNEATVQVLPNRQLLAIEGMLDNLTSLSERAVVYRFTATEECFVLPESIETIPNPNGYPSALGSPTFFRLEKALKYYGRQVARKTTCKLLADCWHDSLSRLLLTNKPEAIMRGSLAQYLRTALRDHAEVFEESNVSETEPVDIKITFMTTGHRSLVEIKWLGHSVSLDGESVATSYWAPGRVNEGAKQLAGYLEKHENRSPSVRTVGHLVVFDARREGITSVPPDISHEQAWAYRERDFDEIEQESREDFATPTRFYLEPSVL